MMRFAHEVAVSELSEAEVIAAAQSRRHGHRPSAEEYMASVATIAGSGGLAIDEKVKLIRQAIEFAEVEAMLVPARIA